MEPIMLTEAPLMHRVYNATDFAEPMVFTMRWPTKGLDLDLHEIEWSESWTWGTCPR